MKCDSQIFYRSRQGGIVTLAVGILLLLLITLVTLYGARVGLLEQRTSANEYRAKLVHGAAEAGRNNAIEFINANLEVFNTDEPATLTDGSTVQGWRAAGNERWGGGEAVDCDPGDDGIDQDDIDGYSDAEQIACAAGLDGDGAQAVYFYTSPDDNDALGLDVFPVDDHATDRVGVNAGKEGNELRVSYNADLVLCPLNTELVDHDGDATTPEVPRVPDAPEPTCIDDIEGSRYFAVLVRSQGYLIDSNGDIVGEDIDSSGTVDLDEASSTAVAQEVVVKYDLFGAGPKVPLTVASTFGAGGSFDIVANPNGGPNVEGGGKSGAPFSVWSPDSYELGGSTVTCQRYEFFATGTPEPAGDTAPNDQYEICDDCTCPDKQNEQFFYLSSDVKGKGIDIVDEDDDFPDDLFLFTFGVPRTDYTILKELAEPIADCDTLDETSSGLYWSEGACEISSNSIVGTPHNPVLLISEGDVRMNGGAVMFGVVYLFDPPDVAANPDLTLNGGAYIYGAIVGDSGGAGSGTGGNVIVYDEAVLNRVKLSPELQRVSPLPGTWSDRDAP